MDSSLMSIDHLESKIIGAWVFENGKLLADATSKRIDYLIHEELIKIVSSDDGWSVLYIDNKDGRYWELNYPDSAQHGGGAPCLETLSHSEAKKKYNLP